MTNAPTNALQTATNAPATAPTNAHANGCNRPAQPPPTPPRRLHALARASCPAANTAALTLRSRSQPLDGSSQATPSQPADLLDVADRRREGLYGRSEATVRGKDARAYVRDRKGWGELLSGSCAVTPATRRGTTRASTLLGLAPRPTINRRAAGNADTAQIQNRDAIQAIDSASLLDTDPVTVSRAVYHPSQDRGTTLDRGGRGVPGAGSAASFYDLACLFRVSPSEIPAAASLEIFCVRSLLLASRQVLSGALSGFGARPEGCMAGQRGAPMRFSAAGAVSGRRPCRNPPQRGSYEVFR